MKKKFYYYFRITLQKGRGVAGKEEVSREIAVLANQTLSTLANTIVRSFGFNFNHCYGFYNNLLGKYFKSPEMYELFTDIPEDPTPGAKGVTHIKVTTVFPKIGKTMLFLFDYGDNWNFLVELIKIVVAPGNAKYPKISKKIGKAPLQYPKIEDDDVLLTKAEKIKRIVFAPNNKVAKDAHQLIKALFNIEGAFISNESTLDDFLDFDGGLSNDETREMLIEKIADKFGVCVPEILIGETRIWKIVELINKKQENSLFPTLPVKKRSIS